MGHGSEEGVYHSAMKAVVVVADEFAVAVAAAALTTVVVAAGSAAATDAGSVVEIVVVVVVVVVVGMAAGRTVGESREARLETWYEDSERPCVCWRGKWGERKVVEQLLGRNARRKGRKG